jgi:hypothetical protein
MALLKLALALCLMAASAPAAITISCGSPERSFLFQEGIDSFYLDIVERSTYGNLVGQMRRGGAGNAFRARFSLPKQTNTGGQATPACRFSFNSPLLFQCVSARYGGEGELMDSVTSERTKVVASKLDVSARQVQIQTFDAETGHSKTESSLRVRYESDAIAQGADSYAKPYLVEVDYPLKDCKSGEGIETPAH